MKIIIMKTMVLCLIMSQANAAMDFTPEKLRVEKHYRELINQQVEQVTPAGAYHVEVTAILNEAKLRQHYQTQNLKFSLPLSGTILGQRGMALKRDGGATLPLEDLLRFVKSRQIKMGFAGDVTPESSEWVKASIVRTLNLNQANGDVIEAYPLPPSFSAEWVNWYKKMQPSSASGSSPVVNMTEETHWKLWGLIGFFALLLIAAFVHAFQGFRKSLVEEVIKLGQAMSERAADYLSDPVSEVSTAQSMQGVTAEGASSHLLERMDLPMLKVFALDCLSNADMKYAVSAIIFHYCEKKRVSESWEQGIAEHLRPYPPKGTAFPDRQAIESCLNENYMSYRKLSRNEAVLDLVVLSDQQVLDFALTLEEREAGVFLKNLTPMKLAKLIRSVTVETRVHWARLLAQPEATQVNDLTTAAFFMKLRSFAAALPINPVVQADANDSQVKALLISQDFLEEERLYALSNGSQNIYNGFLSLMYTVPPLFWTKVDAKVLATATFGFSDTVREYLVGQLKGKRAQWYRSYVKTLVDQGMDYERPGVSLARDMVLKQIRTACMPLEDHYHDAKAA